MQLSQKYFGHDIFNKIDYLTECYENLSIVSSSHIQRGVSSITNIDCVIYSSLKGTLASIQILLKEGYINDAFALVRKYYEGVIIDIYKSVYIESKYNIFQSLYVEQIEKWYRGEKELPQYKNMIKFLNRTPALKGIRQFYDIQTEGYYSKIKQKCNENLHYNKFSYMLLNDKDSYIKNREMYLSSILIYLTSIFEFHIACIFILHTEYFTASDYIDCLECGIKPTQDSQYWISSFGEELFYELWGEKQNIGEYIKGNTYLVFSDENNSLL